MSLAQLVGYAALMKDLDDVLDSVKGSGPWIVRADVDYAIYVEMGTYKMQAQPYMRPAIEKVTNNPMRYAGGVESTEELLEVIVQAIRDEARGRAPVDTGRLRDSIRVEKA